MEVNLSNDLFELLNGEKLDEKQHEAMMLMSVTKDGWPHNAMISVGEIIAVDKQNLRLALWPGSNTTKNIINTRKALLVIVYKGVVNYIRLNVEPIGILQDAKQPFERFIATIESFKEDVAKYAEVNSGIHITLKQPENVLSRWKETLNELVQ